MNPRTGPSKRTALLAVLVALMTIVTGCGEDSKPDAAGSTASPGAKNGTAEEGTPLRTQHLDGFPLERSMEGLLDFPKVDTIVLVKEARARQALRVPVAVGERDYVVTPVDVQVVEVLRGTASTGEVMTLSIGGGRVGDLVVEADASTAPDITKLVSAESLLVAGENKTLPELGTFLDPYFVYLVDANGQATSLLESATTETNTESFPRFAMSDFRQALASRK